MLPGAQKVLDDLVFIGVERGEALVLPSPDFERTGPGLTGVPRPVAAVFVLSPEGGGGAEATDLVGAAAAAGLCSLPSPAAEDEGAGRALEAAVELAERVPVVRLRFGLGEDELDRIARAAGQARTSARDGPG